jgi:putative DNA primase/helicase
MQERIASIVAGSEEEPPDPSYLSILTPDLQDMAMPNLAHQEDQEAIADLIRDTEVVIVDNLACLARHGRENDSESWLPVQTWLLGLRRQGKSVITVHHAGKGGAQRGTSSREDVLDTVISLRRPKDYDPSEGARFEVHLEKARGVYGQEAAPFEAALRMENGVAIWVCRSLEDSVRAQILALKAEEYSIRDIANETGLSRSKVQRILKGVQG